MTIEQPGPGDPATRATRNETPVRPKLRVIRSDVPEPAPRPRAAPTPPPEPRPAPEARATPAPEAAPDRGDFPRLWTASAISSLGDGVRFAALPLLAARLTRDPPQVSLV